MLLTLKKKTVLNIVRIQNLNRSQSRNQIFSKVGTGTGTATSFYGFITLGPGNTKTHTQIFPTFQMTHQSCNKTKYTLLQCTKKH
jgi:hypothetical protein